jgi:hypothetical protein
LIKIASLGERGRSSNVRASKSVGGGLVVLKDVVAYRVVEFRSIESVRSADRCCSATKASAPKELVGECAAV